jgi:hypothetical protein
VRAGRSRGSGEEVLREGAPAQDEAVVDLAAAEQGRPG